MRHWITGGTAALVLAGAAGPAGAELLYGTNGTTLSRFDSANVASVTTVPVTGLQAGETLVGIDVRPRPTSPGVQSVYGVGRVGATGAGRVYIINPLTGVATQVGTGSGFTLTGSAFGTDFNPVPDRFRLVGNDEQNLRLNPNDGSLSGTDTPLTPGGNIVGVAYDRNFDRNPADTTPTTLYGIDSAAGTLVTIGGINGSPSPNLGAVTIVGSLGVGTALGDNVGFDISGLSGTAFATIPVGGQGRLYSIDLTTGAATNLGQIGTSTNGFLGLAAANAPEPGSLGLLGVGALGLLARRRRRTA